MTGLLADAYEAFKNAGGEAFFWLAGLGGLIAVAVSLAGFRGSRRAERAAADAQERTVLMGDLKELIKDADHESRDRSSKMIRKLQEDIAASRLASSLGQQQAAAAASRNEAVLGEVIRRADAMERRMDLVISSGIDVQKKMGIDRRTSDPVSVMLVDDSPEWLALIVEMLRFSDYIPVLHTAGSVAEGARHRAGIILLDLELVETSGLATLAAMAEHAPHTPIVVFSGSTDLGAAAVKAGAAGFLTKDGVTGAAIEQAVAIALLNARRKGEPGG